MAWSGGFPAGIQRKLDALGYKNQVGAPTLSGPPLREADEPRGRWSFMRYGAQRLRL